jgi:hypothetical protein
MGIKHMIFNEDRDIVPVSATMIRENPIENWEYVPVVSREAKRRKGLSS